jgi:hypothetical protein
MTVIAGACGCQATAALRLALRRISNLKFQISNDRCGI